MAEAEYRLGRVVAAALLDVFRKEAMPRGLRERIAQATALRAFEMLRRHGVTYDAVEVGRFLLDELDWHVQDAEVVAELAEEVASRRAPPPAAIVVDFDEARFQRWTEAAGR